MFSVEKIVEILFAGAMFTNGALFFVQAYKLWTKKNSIGFSFITFFGFAIIQLITIVHGYFNNDINLVVGLSFSFVGCAIVLILIVKYKTD